jgi:hypothetical protein
MMASEAPTRGDPAMAVALILDFPGGTKAQYDAVIEKMDLGGRMPPGGLFHAAGSYQGGWRVTDVWESLGDFERFRDEKIVPITSEVGMPPPNVRMIEVAETKVARGDRPALVQVVTLPGLDHDSFHAADGKVLSGGLPDEMTFHVNGPIEGGWCVIDAWTSKEARDRFIENNVRPGMEGSPLSGPPSFEDLDVEASLTEGAKATA